jgi:hypothetical protein
VQMHAQHGALILDDAIGTAAAGRHAEWNLRQAELWIG